jgi:anti-anti-sigma regulatory factor
LPYVNGAITIVAPEKEEIDDGEHERDRGPPRWSGSCLRRGVHQQSGGEEIARAAYQLIDDGYKVLLLNLAGTRIVNSIGISILIEIIEKLIEIGGRLGFCCLTSTIDKTFHVMGLAQYASIFPDEATAVASLQLGGD